MTNLSIINRSALREGRGRQEFVSFQFSGKARRRRAFPGLRGTLVRLEGKPALRIGELAITLRRRFGDKAEWFLDDETPGGASGKGPFLVVTNEPTAGEATLSLQAG